MAPQVHDATRTPSEDQPTGRPRAVNRPREDSSDQSAQERERDAPTDRPDEGSGPSSVAEWITLAISSLIVLGLFGLTTYFFLTGSNAPASFEVQPHLSETYQAGERFYVPVTVRNSGGLTAEEVRVRVTVMDASGRQEAAEFQVQFLAGGGSSQAVVVFGSDPRPGQIEGGVVSYLEP